MLFSIFYSIFIFSIVVLGGVYLVGPFTVRHIAVLCMFFFILIKRKHLPMEKTMFAYILFVVVFGISSISYGFTDEFYKTLIANYLVCYITYCATVYNIETQKTISSFIYTFIIIGILSGILVIFQYYNVYWAFLIPDMLRTFTEEDGIQLQLNGDTISGQSLPGLFNRVDNGYYLAIATILSTYIYSKVKKLTSLSIWGFLLVSLYMVQQRAALFIGVSMSLIFLLKEIPARQKRIIILFVIIATIVILTDDYNVFSLFEDSRYSKMVDVGTREDLWDISINYISNHLFDANAFAFSKQHPDVAAHNLFLNAFLTSGIFGALLIIYILIILCSRSWVLVKCRNKVKSEYYLTTMGFVAFNFISLTHNNSVVNGNVVFWILATPLMLNMYNKYDVVR